jgi:hypothetical protein
MDGSLGPGQWSAYSGIARSDVVTLDAEVTAYVSAVIMQTGNTEYTCKHHRLGSRDSPG